jgi:hypothetical protein
MPEIDDYAMDVDSVNLSPVELVRSPIQVSVSPSLTQATRPGDATVSPFNPSISAPGSSNAHLTLPSNRGTATAITEEALMNEDEDIEDLYWNPPSSDFRLRSLSRQASPRLETTSDRLNIDAQGVAWASAPTEREFIGSRKSGTMGLATWWMHERHPDGENPWYLHVQNLKSHGMGSRSRRKINAKKLDQSRVPNLVQFAQHERLKV